jgi:carbon-monoxide dehydrogenase large subunit
MGYVGSPLKRKEDPRLITGQGTYVDDITLPGTLFCAFLRSPHGHARLKGIRTEQAARHPGVVAVLTGRDIAGKVGTLPCGWNLPGLKTPPHPVLAVDRVRLVGDRVAAVVAEDRYIARDALDLIEVDYEPLPAVVETERAFAPGAPQIHEEAPDNTAFLWGFPGQGVEEAFAKADRTIRLRLVNHRVIPTAMETRGVLAQFKAAAGDLTVWTSTQVPHLVRALLGMVLDFPEHKLRVIAPEVGGAFGSKLYLYAEEVLVAYLAMLLQRPVKWIEERRENYQVTTHGRDRVDYIEVAVKKDGTILGLRCKCIGNLGAYLSTFAPAIPSAFFGIMLSGAYRIPAIACEVRGVFTNTGMVDAYRGAGRPEACYVLERTVDRIAMELGLDPAEVRRRNFIPAEAYPYTTATGVTYDSANHRAALEKALALVGYEARRKEQAELRKNGRLIGIGLSSYVEICGVGPSKGLAAAGGGGGGWETATVRVHASGKVTVLTGCSPHGQGNETSYAQIVADGLAVSPEDVEVLHGDTHIVPFGTGTFGSRSAAVGGTAVHLSVEKVKEKARAIAAHLLGAPREQVTWDGSRFVVQGDPGRAKTLKEVAGAAHLATPLPSEIEPGLEATTVFDPPNFTWPFGTHVAVVEVDPETGKVQFERYVAVDDCGNVINPLLVDGQVHGGIAQGIGQALYEAAVYDEHGQLLTGSLMDYAVPKADDLPSYETDRTVTPSPVNPLGVKGVGEAGTIAATPCVVNAVIDALSPLGIRELDMPLTTEKIWRAIQAARAGGTGAREGRR